MSALKRPVMQQCTCAAMQEEEVKLAVSFFLWNVQFFFVNLHTTFIHISACLNLQIMSGWDTGQTYHSDPINQVSITDQCQQYHTQKIPPPQHSSLFRFFWRFVFLSKKRNYPTHQPTFLTQSHFPLISCTRAVH